jgi:HEAT repeat protein
MMMTLLLVGFALAGVPEDLRAASNPDLPTDERREALGRVSAANAVDEVAAIIDAEGTDTQLRWVALRSLGFMTVGEARAAIVRYLEHADATTRIAALGAAGDRGDRTLVGRVATRLQDKALLVRAAAADALARLDDPSAIGDLERALAAPDTRHNGVSLWIRRAYVDAMAEIGGDSAVRAMGRALADDDVAVVDAAVRGLERAAGFSYAEGRSREEMLEAWRRWSGAAR